MRHRSAEPFAATALDGRRRGLADRSRRSRSEATGATAFDERLDRAGDHRRRIGTPDGEWDDGDLLLRPAPSGAPADPDDPVEQQRDAWETDWPADPPLVEETWSDEWPDEARAAPDDTPPEGARRPVDPLQ